MDQLLRWSVVRCSTRLDLFKIRVTLIGLRRTRIMPWSTHLKQDGTETNSSSGTGLRPTAVVLGAERRIAAVSIQLLLQSEKVSYCGSRAVNACRS
jgi:hypothetical protein